MIKRISFLLLSCFLLQALPAQDRLSWRKHRNLAEAALEQGDYAEAADHFEKAWQKKRKKEELIHKAAEAYYRIKNYRKAAEAYQHVKDENDEYPLVGLKYARCLKQDAQYDKAKEEFQAFFDQYAGPSKAILEDIIQTEIQGCELGKEAPSRANRQLEIVHLNNAVNTDSREFAPIPVATGELYFSSTMGGTARIYSTEGRAGEWAKARTPDAFPVIRSGQFCHGAFSPDGNRFYFTICEEGSLWDDLNTRCEIFALVRERGAWSEPKRLPDYINTQGVTATHPSVAHVGGLEILYFSSNRDGGRGSMDIWYASRDLGTSGLDFTFPVNLGPGVNTYGDEIAPFFNPQDGTLYFASNGHVSMGGFDIFRTTGQETNWTYPENMGMPVNSSADDYFFALTPTGAAGFLTSNRVFGGQKITTTNDDIFYFTSGRAGATSGPVAIRGDVLDETSGAPVASLNAYVYRLGPNNQEQLLESEGFNGGAYRFEVPAGPTYRIEVSSLGYVNGSYIVTTDKPGQVNYGQPLYLRPSSSRPDSIISEPDFRETERRTDRREPTTTATGDPMPTPESRAGATYTARGKDERDNFEFITSAPRYRGVYYKVQLIALRNYEPDNPAFDGVKNIGRIDTEKLVSKELTRVLVADFFSLSEAKSALAAAQNNGFPNAYIVRYEDGERYGKLPK